MFATFADLERFAWLASLYRDARAAHPALPAARVLAAVKRAENDGIRLDEALCPGHEWAYTGSAYGGDDERWHGEGRCYCLNCGADGDA